MGKKWEFFNSLETAGDIEKKEKSKKVPGKFLNWISLLLKNKKETPSSINFPDNRGIAENLKQEVVSVPEEDRAEAESFLEEEISKIEKRREGFRPELGDEVSFRGSAKWYVSDIKNNGELLEIRRSRKDPKGREVLERNIVRSDEISLPKDSEAHEEVSSEEVISENQPESFANKFKLGEKVSFLGDPGWKVESTAGNQVEIGKIRKDFRDRDVYERMIVSDDELVGVAQHENRAFKIGELISINNEPGWEVVSLAGDDGKYLEVGKIRADKKGALVFERKIVEAKEIKRGK